MRKQKSESLSNDQKSKCDVLTMEDLNKVKGGFLMGDIPPWIFDPPPPPPDLPLPPGEMPTDMP